MYIYQPLALKLAVTGITVPLPFLTAILLKVLPAFTGSLKVTVIVLIGLVTVVPFAGLTFATFGGKIY